MSPLVLRVKLSNLQHVCNPLPKASNLHEKPAITFDVVSNTALVVVFYFDCETKKYQLSHERPSHPI